MYKWHDYVSLFPIGFLLCDWLIVIGSVYFTSHMRLCGYYVIMDILMSMFMSL